MTGEKDPVDTFITLAEDHDIACHYGELSFGYDAFMALNKNKLDKSMRI
jgi:hypothetical protein